MTLTNDENRKYIRLGVNCEVRFRIEEATDDKEGENFTVEAKNVSVGGLTFEFWNELSLGQILRLKLKFKSDPEILKLRGDVIHCTPLKNDDDSKARFTIGVKFIGSDKALTAALLRFI